VRDFGVFVSDEGLLNWLLVDVSIGSYVIILFTVDRDGISS